MKRYIPLFLILMVALPFSCTKQDREATILTQEANIDRYLSSKFPDSTVIRLNGSNKVVLTKVVSKDSLEFGDSLYFYYAGFIFSNGPGTMFATNWEEAAEANKFYLTNPDYSIMKVKYERNSFIPGLTHGLFGVREGEQSVIVFSAKYGFNNTSVYNIPKLSPLLYQVFIDKVIKAQ